MSYLIYLKGQEEPVCIEADDYVIREDVEYGKIIDFYIRKLRMGWFKYEVVQGVRKWHKVTTGRAKIYSEQ